MSTGTVIGLFVAAVLFLGFGIFVLVISIRGLMSSQDPDITMSTDGGPGTQIGRNGLYFFLVLALILAAAGIAFLVGAIKAVAS